MVGVVSRFACVWVPFFLAAAEERCEPRLRELPLAVVAGASPATRVVEANAMAREQGVEPGMTETEARARCPALVSRAHSHERVASARYALLDAALAVSPRVEAAAAGLVYVDTEGLDRLIGDPGAIGARLVREAGAIGLPARVGIAGSRTAVRVAARLGRRVTVIPSGRERAWLASAPLSLLDLSPDLSAAFARWGIRTLGELAALPRQGLLARLGPSGLRAHDLALGLDPGPFRPYAPPPFYREAQEIEWEVDSLVVLTAVFRGVLERLCARLQAGRVYVDALDVELRLATGGRHERAISLAYPAREVEPMLTLVGIELERHPPAAPVTEVALSANPVRVRAGQGGLWDSPAPPCRDLAFVLARLAALVGARKVGSPLLLDSHRPDAFRMVPFTPPSPQPLEESSEPDVARLVLRRLRPPRSVEVGTEGERPARLISDGSLARVVGCAGPWRASGEWWDSGTWARDEWDVALDDGRLCRLVRDRLAARWYLDGLYD